MSEKLLWICDGCDDELVRELANGTDWKAVEVQLSGFAGYPTCATEPAPARHYHLCPHCARRYFEDANPRNWVRSAIPNPGDQ